MFSFCGTINNLNKINMANVIHKRHKRILLNLFGKYCQYDYDAICKHFSIMKISDIYKYYLMLLIFKSFHSQVFLDLSNWLTDRSGMRHDYNTRFGYQIQLPFPRINLIKYGYIYNSIKILNELKIDLNVSISLEAVKKKLKRILTDNY